MTHNAIFGLAVSGFMNIKRENNGCREIRFLCTKIENVRLFFVACVVHTLKRLKYLTDRNRCLEF